MLIMYLTIPSEPDYFRPLLVTRMVPSVLPSINYKNIASDASSLQPRYSPSFESIVISSIAISIIPIKVISLTISEIHSDTPSGLYLSQNYLCLSIVVSVIPLIDIFDTLSYVPSIQPISYLSFKDSERLIIVM